MRMKHVLFRAKHGKKVQKAVAENCYSRGKTDFKPLASHTSCIKQQLCIKKAATNQGSPCLKELARCRQ